MRGYGFEVVAKAVGRLTIRPANGGKTPASSRFRRIFYGEPVPTSPENA
jgi:hypothetical protein